MIWLILAVLVSVVSLVLLAPWRSQTILQTDQELAEARAQLAALEADLEAGRISPEMAAESQSALEARVLDLLNASDSAPHMPSATPKGLWLIPAFLAVAGPVIYYNIGAPTLTPLTEVQAEEQAREEFAQDVADLAVRLEAENETTFEPYVMLARGHMSLDQFTEGLAAYDKALELSENNPDLRAEVESAYAYVARREGRNVPAPTPEAVAAISALPEDEQAAMIDGMVANLAARLDAEPLDPDGWVRLIRARLVLEQYQDADTALFKARDALQAQPDLLAAFEAGMAPIFAEYEVDMTGGDAQNSGKP